MFSNRFAEKVRSPFVVSKMVVKTDLYVDEASMKFRFDNTLVEFMASSYFT